MKSIVINIILAAVCLFSFLSCNKAKDPESDNTAQFVGTYTEDVTGANTVTMSIRRIDNNRFFISYASTLLNIEFECRVTYSGSVPLFVNNATFFQIPLQNITTQNTSQTVTIVGKSPNETYIPNQNGYLWTTDKTRLTFSAEITGAITQTIGFTGIKNQP